MASDDSSGPRTAISRLSSTVLTLAVAFGLLGAVYLLPSDTSLSEIERIGRLSVCVPTSYPPLITGDPDMPGIDVELLGMIADRMELGLSFTTNAAMGRDFNPRNWRITRAQCQMIAGGVVLSDLTRSFLDSTDPYLETGWAVVSPQPLNTLRAATLGVYSGLTGLDRLSLTRLLRDQGVSIAVVNSPEALIEGIQAGRFAGGISEALTARQIAGSQGWTVQWVSEELGQLPIGFGLWKGDLTLQRRVVETLDQLNREGALEALIAKYKVAPIEESVIQAGATPAGSVPGRQ